MSKLLRGAKMTEIVAPAYIADADIIVFNGGADIGTQIYGESNINGVPLMPSNRDRHEIDIFNRFSDPKRLKVGICRGAQLLNCLNGGTLWQDVNNHGRDHMMTVLATGVTMPITSTHHQMMRPARGAEIIATADESTRKRAFGVMWEKVIGGDAADHDMEVVYYRDTNSLCIQGHPEYVPGSIFANWCIDQMCMYLQEARQKCAA